MYIFFIESVLKKFKAEDNKVVVIFDHTTCEDRLVILSFMLSVGKRGIPLYYKVYDYKVPVELESKIELGKRVEVSFGR